MIPVVSIVGKSNAGKTTLLVKIILLLKQKGYRIATIKHNRRGFDIDHEGKDSWRLKHAGSFITVMSSPQKVALVEDVEKDYTLEEIIEKYVGDADIILTEGFKGNPYPKIEVFRCEQEGKMLYTRDANYLAIASDCTLKVQIPRFDINDIEGLVHLIEERVLRGEH